MASTAAVKPEFPRSPECDPGVRPRRRVPTIGRFASGIRRFGAACAVGLSAGVAASAAEPVVQPPTVSDLYIVTINANLKADPRFPGSDRLTLLGYPSMGLRRADEPQRFTTPDDGLSFSFLSRHFCASAWSGATNPDVISGMTAGICSDCAR